MRNKRLIAIIAALTLLFTQMNFVVGSAEEATVAEETSLYTESELASFESKREMLLDIGLFPEMDKTAEDTISRGEFAGIMEKVLGNSFYQADFKENTYIDVKELTSNATAIISLKKMGLMVGVNNVEFMPEKKVTYSQAVKVMVSALGYKELAELNGGYYNGYLKVAIDLGLLRKGAADYNRELTVYDAVLLIDAAIESEVPVIQYMDYEGVTYVNNDTLDLLRVFHNIYIKKGIMTDNGQTALSGKSAVGIGNTVIDGMRMLNMDEKFTGLIGQNVIAYYRDDSIVEVLHVRSNSSKNKILVIDAYDLVTDSSEFTKSNIVYKNEKGKSEDAKASVYADFIYNGAADVRFVGETLKIPTGKLTLIDANMDHEYETIIAETFVDYLVKTVNTTIGAIYSNYADPILYSKYDVVHYYDAAGEEIELADITNDSLISVYQSKDFTKLLVYKSDIKTSMVIDSIEEDEAGNLKVTAGESTYDIAKFYLAAMRNPEISLKVPVVGAKYDVYVNVIGEAAFFLDVQNREEYAYLVAVGTDSTNKLSGTKAAVKVVNEQGDCVEVKAAKKFTVIDSKGVHENDSDAVLNSADLYNTSGNFVPQLIRIKINAKGEFTQLEYDNTNPKTGELPNGFNETKFNKIYGPSSASSYSAYSSKNLGGKYIIDKNTKIFFIDSPGKTSTTDETLVKVIPYGKFAMVGLQVTAYDADSLWRLGAIVCCPTITSFDDRTFTVKSSKIVIDEFGEERCQVTGFWKNNFWTFREHTPGVFAAAVKAYNDAHAEAADFNVYSTVKAGDVFQVQFDNEKQEVAKANLVMSPVRDEIQIRKGVAPYTATDYANATWAQVIGYPISGSDGSIGILANGEYYVETLSSASYVSIFDTRTGELIKGDKLKVPTIGSVDKAGNIDIGDGSIMIYGFRQRQHLQDILIVLK